jgi:hypothetical protein
MWGHVGPCDPPPLVLSLQSDAYRPACPGWAAGTMREHVDPCLPPPLVLSLQSDAYGSAGLG